ncbi:SOS response-associated peptidase family protein [Shewanella sp. 125m-1]
MCGRLNIIDDMFVQALMQDLQVKNAEEMLFGRFKIPTNDISIVREIDGERRLQTATWWLLLETCYEGFKPSRYTSFNTRFNKLNTPNSAGFNAFRESRCVIVASGFGETDKRGKETYYHDFIAENSAMAFGGLFREWQHPKTGEITTSCSIITNPPHPDLMPFHSKASPMILPQNDEVLDAWLNPANQQVEMFDDLLKPTLRHDFTVQQINKPSQYQPIGQTTRLIPNDYYS